MQHKRQLEFGLIYHLNRERRRGERALTGRQMTFSKINEPLGKQMEDKIVL